MKPHRWQCTLLALLLIMGMYSQAAADWVNIDEAVVVTQPDPPSVTSDGSILMRVQIWNQYDGADIEGKLRLIITTNDAAFPYPDNALLAGEDGNNPTHYYDISTLQEEYFETGEIAYVDMLFPAGSLTEEQLGSLQSYYTLQVELNDASVLSELFRKKISRTPEAYSGEAIIKTMEVYVKARSTKGQPYIRDSAGELASCCKDGESSDECVDCSAKTEADFAKVKPLIVTFIEEEKGVPFNNVPSYDPDNDGTPDGLRYARDVYAAVSLDDGLTWKRKNISRTSEKSSFTVDTSEGPVEYPGDSESQDLVVGGHYALVTWVDKFCRSGNPWDISKEDDIYHVSGSQKSKDYTDVKGDEEPRPDLGVRPFSCVWASRGVLELNPESPDYGTLVWYKPEQMSSGRRDAIHNFTAVAEPVYDSSASPVEGTGGFAVTWQEDPQGLKTGHGRGPGVGMSGASVNHKTDIWYSYIDWAKFAAVDTEFIPSGTGDDADSDGESDGYTEYICPTCSHVYDPLETGIKFADLPEDWVCPVDGTAKSEFIKVTRPRALHTMSPPVPITNNAVCRERNPIPIYAHVHKPEETDCDHYYEGGTTNEPLLWEELPDDWVCPKCGRPKSSFEDVAVYIKDRHEGGPYCQQFAGNPRIDQDGNYAIPESEDAEVAFYTQDGDWQDALGNTLGSEPGDATIDENGVATIGDTRVYWSGEPLDGNTGASRANLVLMNFNKETLALMAYEETKGVGVGSDKQAAAMEQKAPYPLVKMEDGSWEAGATNSDCRSCHYQNVVPRDRFIPMSTETDCQAKGATWSPDREAYYPYTGYPFLTEESVSELPAGVSIVNPLTGSPRKVPCIKYQGGRKMYPRDWEHTDPDAYYDLPDHMPGWHQAALNCSKCHLPYNTKDLDGDKVMDRVDLCLETPAGETVNMIPTSATYGCSATQDPNDPDNNKDEPDRYRHGKNVYYHHFNFAHPETVAQGIQVNLRNKFGWSEQGDIYENARRVRLVPNEAYNPAAGADVTLGILYKEGKDGQGAPADAMVRLFRNGFGAENLDPEPLNMSSSTPFWFQPPSAMGNEDGTGDNTAGDGSGDLIGNHKTPHAGNFFWTENNLHDSSGFWQEDSGGEKKWQDDGYTPVLEGNPFENVFSARLAIRGNTIVSGFAHCANWAAGKKGKDHYDFYVRVSKDSGRSWTLPFNVSNIKNNKESVSDCRVNLTPETIDQQYPAEPGFPADISMNGAPEVFDAGDFNNPNILFVAVGTKENTPQAYPSEDEEDEVEIYKDIFFSKATITGTTGGQDGDLGLAFESYPKANPLYVAGSKMYLDSNNVPTDEPTDGNGYPNKPNPAYPENLDEFNWMAKGDALQGDVQFSSNPFGTTLYTTWEQDLPLYEEDGKQHFQGSDVWFRKVSYPDPAAATEGDVDGDGDTDWDDGRLIQTRIGTTAYEPDFLWAGDYISDFRITGHDFNRWKVQFMKETQKKQLMKGRSK